MTESTPIPGVSLGRRLAVGGMGELFLGERVRPDGGREPCVVKRLLPGAGEAERFLFAREARALEAAAAASEVGPSEPGIVRVLESHPDALVLEHVDGVDLGTLLDARRRRGRPLPVAAGLAAVVGLARGLATLARLGIVHRDVHPGNVLLGRDGRVCLADLGVATFTAESGATIAGLKGTLAYMAPEQLRDGLADRRSDLYAAGLVAYETLTGLLARPSGAVGLAELLRARERLPTRPSEVRPELGPLDDAVLAALAPDPSARPASAEAWLDAVLAGGLAAGASPDRAALGAAVEAVAERPVAVAGAAGRTVNLRGAGGPAPIATSPVGTTGGAEVSTATAPTADAVPAAGHEATAPAVEPAGAPVPPASASRVRRWGWAVGGIALVAAGLGAWAAARPSTEVADRHDGRALGALASVAAPRLDAPDAALAVDVDAGPVAATAADAVPAADADAVEAADAAAVEDAADARDAHRADASHPSDAASPPAARRHRVHFEGEVHVAGGGVRGLAPGPSWSLMPGEIVPIRVVGGSPPIAARVRVAAKDDGLRVNVAAEAGEVYDATCGARAAPTPIVGLVVAPGGAVACRLRAANGATMAFVVVDALE